MCYLSWAKVSYKVECVRIAGQGTRWVMWAALSTAIGRKSSWRTYQVSRAEAARRPGCVPNTEGRLKVYPKDHSSLDRQTAHSLTRDCQHLGMKNRYLVGFRGLMSKNILVQLITPYPRFSKHGPVTSGMLMTLKGVQRVRSIFIIKQKVIVFFNLIFSRVYSRVSQRRLMCDICLLLSQTSKRLAKVQTMPLFSLNYIVLGNIVIFFMLECNAYIIVVLKWIIII